MGDRPQRVAKESTRAFMPDSVQQRRREQAIMLRRERSQQVATLGRASDQLRLEENASDKSGQSAMDEHTRLLEAEQFYNEEDTLCLLYELSLDLD